MQSDQVVTLKSGRQNAGSVDSKPPVRSFDSYKLNTNLVGLESPPIPKLNHESEAVKIGLRGLDTL